MSQEWVHFKQKSAQSLNTATEAINGISAQPSYEYYRVVGDKAIAFLQGQLTNDLTKLSAQHWLYAAHCNIKGRVIGLYNLWQQQDTIYLQIAKDIAATAIETLAKYAKFSRVSLEIQPHLMTLHLWGPTIKALLGQTFNATLLEQGTSLCLENLSILYTPAHVPTYQIIASEEVCHLLWQQWRPALTDSDENAWNHIAIQNGIARLYPTTVGTFTPHELALPALDAVNFHKGCYTGQEIIARMQYRGKLKSHLYQATLHTTSAPLPGQELQQQQRTCGQIVMAAQTHHGEYAVLAILPDDAIGTPITLNDVPLINIQLANSLLMAHVGE